MLDVWCWVLGACTHARPIHKRVPQKRGGGGAPTREKNKACVQKQKVWNSSTTWAFPLSPGMKINYKLDVPLSIGMEFYYKLCVPAFS